MAKYIHASLMLPRLKAKIIGVGLNMARLMKDEAIEGGKKMRQ